MKVEGPGAARTAAARRAGRPAAAGDGAFARELARSGEAGGAAPASGVSGVQALIAAQAVDEPGERSRRARRRAHDLLDRLDEIRAALLAGALPEGVLRALAARLAEARDEVEDPGLAAVLDEVDLRAQVELAKLEALR
jgi:hypothetical protein